MVYVHDSSQRHIQGLFAIRGLALATIYPSTKFEVSISTHYEGDTKYLKWDGLGYMVHSR